MHTNFDFLKSDLQFASFADTAAQAEMVLPVSSAFAATGCRTALEFAVKWLYSADESLAMPYDKTLVALLNSEDFKDLLPTGLFQRIDYIRKIGNNAAHNPGGVTNDQASLALEYLHGFLSFISYCYSADYHETAFDKTLPFVGNAKTSVAAPTAVPPASVPESAFDAMLGENASKRGANATLRVDRLKKGYTVKPIDFTESQTRRAYIDLMLEDAGWRRDVNWAEEYPIGAMPNKSGRGSADYVLFGDDGLPLAVIEAKRTSVNPEEGRQKAKLYADYLEDKFKRRPIIFLSNGYETRIWNDKFYPERIVSGIYSKRDLEKEFNKMNSRVAINGVRINENITNRYYQKEAIQAVCDVFGERNRRKALLVMATGSGKTRVVISLVDVLERYGWVKNILFLADRTALVNQAKRFFSNHLPDMSLCNLAENKEDASARAVFSTYQTMINCIDDTCDEQGDRLFTPGHFDLIIMDEAHRSIFNKYKDIFAYFDALLIGLTATPKDEVDKNTYGIFDLESGVPTYGYDLADAVNDGYLVDFVSIETELKFLTDGIVYDDLPADEKDEYEKTFADEDGDIPEAIDASAFNDWLFNDDTIKKALYNLKEYAQYVEYGSKIGKTIIFAKSHIHAEKILEVWNKEFPDYPSGYCNVIDNKINYTQKLIDDFSDPKKYPQIAISVDMLDTGIDIPEILNLVFFKKVFSKAKFWQMIGRGTRLCPGLIDGKDKEQFYTLDLCGNFVFFRLGAKGREASAVASLQERIFNIKVEMIYKLQSIMYQSEELRAYREQLVQDIVLAVQSLNRDSFAVKLHLQVVDQYKNATDFNALTYENTLQIAEHIAPLIPLPTDEISAVRFDMLLYRIELSMLSGQPDNKAKNDIKKKTGELSRYATIPAVMKEQELIDQILHNDFLERAGVKDYEDIRTRLRGLIIFIPDEERVRYDTNFEDEIVSVNINESLLDNNDLANYKKKVNYYLMQNQGIPAIAKLKSNIPLSFDDVKSLEHILWNELGTKAQYDAQYGKTPLGELVRSIVGLSQKAANEAFSAFLNDARLDSRQMHFIRQIINYIVKNGIMKDLAILQESPFTDLGSVSDVFKDDIHLFMALRTTIGQINDNAAA